MRLEHDLVVNLSPVVSILGNQREEFEAARERRRTLELAACRTWIGFPRGGQFCRGLGVNRK
jgi:hypothetical protein